MTYVSPDFRDINPLLKWAVHVSLTCPTCLCLCHMSPVTSQPSISCCRPQHQTVYLLSVCRPVTYYAAQITH